MHRPLPTLPPLPPGCGDPECSLCGTPPPKRKRKRGRKFLSAYLATEAAIHDSLSLFAAITLITLGNPFGWVLVVWAVSELIIKSTAAYVLWPKGGGYGDPVSP